MLATRLKEARETAGITQKELADKIGVSQPAYYYMENGVKTPSLPVAIELAKVLNVSLDYLVGNSDNKYVNA